MQTISLLVLQLLY